MAELGDARALHAACRALTGPGAAHATVLLIKLGEPAAIPALRDACARAGDRPTMLVWALQSCGEASSLLESSDRIVRW